MTSDIRQAVGRPNNSVFIRNCIIYCVILAVMLFAAPSVFAKIMVPVAAKGMTTAWYAVFVPIIGVIMAIGLFRAWRRRWPLAYMENYRSQVKANGYETCPRCGAAIAVRTRQVTYRAKVGEKHITTTYSDGSQSTRVEDITQNRTRMEEYYICSNSSCNLEPDRRYSQSHLPWKIKEIRTLVCAEGSGRSSKTASDLLLSRLFAPFLAAVIVVACVVTIYSYANSHDGEWTYATVDKQPDRSAEEYQTYLLSLDTEYAHWYITCEKDTTTMMNYLAGIFKKGKAVSYTVGCYHTQTGDIYDYRFEGDDAGTGIPHGWYTLTTMEGIPVLIDEDNKTIYKAGTEFYETYAPKLLELTHDTALTPILEQASGGEHGIYNGSVPMEFMRRDTSTVFSYQYTDDTTYGNEFRAVITNLDEQTEERWYFNYRTDDYYPDEWDGFVYADDTAFQADDELGKLMQKSFEDSGSVVFCKNGEEVLLIAVEYFPDGYAFEIEGVAEGYGNGLEEDMVYRIHTADKTLTKIENYDYSDEIRTDLPLAEHQATYDFLMSIVPHTYIRSIIDMDQAEVRKESLGLKTIYEMKDENGNVTADMKLAFGKIGEVIHYTAEDEYVKIELGY